MTAWFELTHRAHFASPCSAVFALLSDPRQRPRWQRSVRSVQLLDPGEPRAGMRWRERPAGLATFTLEIIQYEPERAWAERFSSALVSGTVALRFSAHAADATTVDATANVSLHGLARFGSAIARELLHREMTGDLQRAERLLANSWPTGDADTNAGADRTGP